jgi:hypothetical protein
MRASEPVSCWPHKPSEWRSTRQPATNLRGSRSMGGPLARNQQMRVQLPPLPPSPAPRSRIAAHRLGGRSAARTRVFGTRYGSSSLPLPTKLIRNGKVRATRKFSERRPTGEVPGRLPGSGEFDSRTLRHFSAMWTSWLSHPSFKRVIAGSNPAIAATGLKLIRMSK